MATMTLTKDDCRQPPADADNQEMALEDDLIPTRRLFAEPSIGLFLCLQALDVVTTLIGLRLGGQEGNGYISHLLQTGPVSGLLISKIIAAGLAAFALFLNRKRVIGILNYWFAAVVTWNLIAIWVMRLR